MYGPLDTGRRARKDREFVQKKPMDILGITGLPCFCENKLLIAQSVPGFGRVKIFLVVTIQDVLKLLTFS